MPCGAGCDDGQRRHRRDDRGRLIRRSAGGRACPCVSVVQRSAGTDGSSAPVPSGHWTRTRTALPGSVGAEAHEHPRVVGRGIAAIERGTSPQRRPVGADDRHARAEHVAPPVTSDQSQTDPVASLPMSFDEQLQRSAGVADHHVRSRHRCRCRRTRRRGRRRVRQRPRRPGRHVLEAAVAQIAIELVAHLQRERIVGTRLSLDRRHASVDRQQVEPRVVVVVEPGGAEAGLRQARRAEPGRGPCGPRRRPAPSLTYRMFICAIQLVTNRSSSPSLSKSPASMPMLASASPRAVDRDARPERGRP